MRALAQTQGNRAAAARALGLHEKYFLRLLKSLGIGGVQLTGFKMFKSFKLFKTIQTF